MEIEDFLFVNLSLSSYINFEGIVNIEEKMILH